MSSPQRNITLRFLAEPQDVNFGGKVHGGAVMSPLTPARQAGAAAIAALMREEIGEEIRIYI